MANKRIRVPLRLDEEMLKHVDKLVAKGGPGATRNAWLEDLIERELKIKLGLKYILRKKK